MGELIFLISAVLLHIHSKLSMIVMNGMNMYFMSTLLTIDNRDKDLTCFRH